MRFFLTAGRGGFELSGNDCLDSSLYVVIHSHEVDEGKQDGAQRRGSVQRCAALPPGYWTLFISVGAVAVGWRMFRVALLLPASSSLLSPPRMRVWETVLIVAPACCSLPACPSLPRRVPAGLAREDEPGAHQAALLRPPQVHQLPAQRAGAHGRPGGRL